MPTICNDGGVVRAENNSRDGGKMNNWKAIHGASGTEHCGTERGCKAWARARDGAQVLNNGFVVWYERRGKLVRV